MFQIEEVRNWVTSDLGTMFQPGDKCSARTKEINSQLTQVLLSGNHEM